MDESAYKDHYDVQNRHWWFVAKKHIILATIDQFTSGEETPPTILDAGCGPGLMLGELEKIGVTSGMDFSEEALRFSGKHFNGELRKANLPGEVPFADSSFDLLLALDVIEHISDDIGALEAFRKMLKAGGTGILTVPAFMFLWSEHDELNHHIRRYTLPELKRKIETAGFEIEKLSYYNTFLFPLIALNRFLFRILGKKADSDLQIPGTFVNSLLMRIFSLEKYFLKYLNLPFGVSILAVIRKRKG